MNNVTYADINLTTNDAYGDGETYSKLSTVQQFSTSHLRPQIQLQDKPTRFQSELNTIKSCNLKTPACWKKMVLVSAALILLLISLVSIAMSVAAYAQSSSNDRSELDKTNQVLSSVQTQLATTQINMSHILTQLDAKLSNFISTVHSQNEHLQIQLYCGPGRWQRVAYLNMSDPTVQCPSVWELYNASGVRACGRPQSDAKSCRTTAYSTNNYQYSRVCGRVIGYQVGTPDAFSYRYYFQNTFYLDGIVISHGIRRDIIWSYVAGQTESQSSRSRSKCPCTSGGRTPPQSVREKYYCESGNPNTNAMQDTFYASDKLWDGEQCEGTCCTGTKFPPWFSVQLSAPTNDSIEVHICCDESTSDEDTPVELLELYVQ